MCRMSSPCNIPITVSQFLLFAVNRNCPIIYSPTASFYSIKNPFFGAKKKKKGFNYQNFIKHAAYA